jgi:hypothetical protein
MSYGQLNRSQVRAVRLLIRGREVHDLGCGDRVLTKELVRLGARFVVAVDANPMGFDPGPPVMTVEQTFEDFLKTEPVIDVAFLSWPSTSAYSWLQSTVPAIDAIVELVVRSRQVVYLGKNTDGTLCGRPELFQHLVRRPLLVHVPSEWNTLIAYGSGVVEREPVLEEQAGMDMTRVYRSVPASCPAEAEET